VDAPELDRFLDSLQAAGVPGDELASLRDGAAAVFRAAAGAPVRPVHVDEALRHARWQGAEPAALAAIRRAGERLVAWQRETFAATPPDAEAQPAAPDSPADVEPPPPGERFNWMVTALQVTLTIAVIVLVSRIVSLDHARIVRSPAELEMDAFLRQQRDEEAARAAAERGALRAPAPAAQVRKANESAMAAFRAGQAAARNGMLEDARRELTRAVAFEPDFTEAYLELSTVNNGLARKAAQAGERSDALRYFHDSLSDQRRARELAAVDVFYLYANSWTRSSCLARTAQTLASAERLERDDSAALAALGYRPGGGTRTYPRRSRYASGREYNVLPSRDEPELPGPTQVEPSVVRPSRVRPSVVRPSYIRPRVPLPDD
jgi:tetratricopeptide (TPR) repeat protein